VFQANFIKNSEENKIGGFPTLLHAPRARCVAPHAEWRKNQVRALVATPYAVLQQQGMSDILAFVGCASHRVVTAQQKLRFSINMGFQDWPTGHFQCKNTKEHVFESVGATVLKDLICIYMNK
jgi:hypothetical protein